MICMDSVIQYVAPGPDKKDANLKESKSAESWPVVYCIVPDLHMKGPKLLYSFVNLVISKITFYRYLVRNR